MEALGAGGGIESQRNIILALVTGNVVTAVLFILLYLNANLALFALWPTLWALLASLALWPIKTWAVKVFEAYVDSDMGLFATLVTLLRVPARIVGDVLRQVKRAYTRRVAPLVRPMWLNMRKRGEGWRIAANFLASVLRLRDNGPLSRALGIAGGQDQHHHHHHHHHHAPSSGAVAAASSSSGTTEAPVLASRRSASSARLVRGRSLVGNGEGGMAAAAASATAGGIASGGRAPSRRRLVGPPLSSSRPREEEGAEPRGRSLPGVPSGPSSACVSRSVSASPSSRLLGEESTVSSEPEAAAGVVASSSASSATADEVGQASKPPTYPPRRESDLGNFHTDAEDDDERSEVFSDAQDDSSSSSDSCFYTSHDEDEGGGGGRKGGRTGRGTGPSPGPLPPVLHEADNEGDDEGSDGEVVAAAPLRASFRSPSSSNLSRPSARVHTLRDDEVGEDDAPALAFHTAPRRRGVSSASQRYGSGDSYLLSTPGPPVVSSLPGIAFASPTLGGGAGRAAFAPFPGAVPATLLPAGMGSPPPSHSPGRTPSPPPPLFPATPAGGGVEADEPPVSTLFWRVLALSYLAYFVILYRNVCLLLLAAWISLGATYGGATFLLSLTPVQAQVQKLLSAPEVWLQKRQARSPSKGRRVVAALWRGLRLLSVRAVVVLRTADQVVTHLRRSTLQVLRGWIGSIVAVGLIAGVILLVSGATVFFTFKMVDEGVQSVAELRGLMGSVVDRSSSSLSFQRGQLPPVLAFLAAASADSFNATAGGSGPANVTGLVDSGVNWLVDRWPNETAVISELWRLAKDIDVSALQGSPAPTLSLTSTPVTEEDEASLAGTDLPLLVTTPPDASNGSVAVVGDDGQLLPAGDAANATVATAESSNSINVSSSAAAVVAPGAPARRLSASSSSSSSTSCVVPDFTSMKSDTGASLGLAERAVYVLAVVVPRDPSTAMSCWLELSRAVVFPAPGSGSTGGSSGSTAQTAAAVEAGAVPGTTGSASHAPSPSASTTPASSRSSGLFDRILAFTDKLSSGSTGEGSTGILSSKRLGGLADALGLPAWVAGGSRGEEGAVTAAGEGGSPFIGVGGPFGSSGNATVWSPLVSALRNATSALPSAADVARSGGLMVVYTVRAASLLTNYAITASASLASFIITLLLFLNLLFYLLSAPTLWLEAMFGFLPLDAQTRVLGALSSTVQQVFLVNAKSCAFHALFTYLLLTVLDVHFVYTAVAASTIGAVIPFFPTVLVTVPAGIEVALKIGGYSGAVLGCGLVGFHWLVVGYADWYFYADLPHGHPSVLGLSILAGMAAFGAPGAVVGPLLVSLLAAVFIIYAETVRRVTKSGGSSGSGEEGSSSSGTAVSAPSSGGSVVGPSREPREWGGAR